MGLYVNKRYKQAVIHVHIKAELNSDYGFEPEARENKRPGGMGTLTGKYTTGHGLAFEVSHRGLKTDEYEDNLCWYDADELVLRAPYHGHSDKVVS